jgi:hypothetical protein
MSYYQSNYYRNPIHYTSSDIGEPVPGWGLSPILAGPARVGVGRTEDVMYQYTGCSSCSGYGQAPQTLHVMRPELVKTLAAAVAKKEEEKPFPAWGYFAIAGGAAAILVGGAIYLKRTGKI